MLKLEIGMSNKRGFTLIEILVVLVIIGITLGFVLLALGDFGAKRRIILASEQFVNYVKLIQQQAILETNTLGVVVVHNTYQAMYFDSSSHWRFFPKSGIFRKREFPSPTELQFQPKIVSGNGPQIVINESGDMNAFNLRVNVNNEPVAVIVGHHNGAIVLEEKKS